MELHGLQREALAAELRLAEFEKNKVLSCDSQCIEVEQASCSEIEKVPSFFFLHQPLDIRKSKKCRLYSIYSVYCSTKKLLISFSSFSR